MSDTPKINLPPFNKDYWITQLKKECGLSPSIPYSELHTYIVDFDSPTGRGKIKKNAKEYVDEQLSYIEEEYKNAKDTGDTSEYEKIINSTLDNKKEPEQLKPVEMKETPMDKFVFLDVTVPTGNFTIMINTEAPDATNHVDFVINSPYFIGARNRHELNGLENIITYYSYFNLVASIPRPKQELSAFEKIGQGMDTVFDGIKLDWNA